MSTSHPTPARWIVVYLWITTAMALAFSLLAYMKPEVQFAGWPALTQTGALSLAGPLGLYLARNLATAAAGLVALLDGSCSAIKVALVLRLVTDGADAAHNALAGNLPGAGFAAAMWAVEVWALLRLPAAK